MDLSENSDLHKQRLSIFTLKLQTLLYISTQSKLKPSPTLHKGHSTCRAAAGNQTSQVLDWLCLWHFVVSRTKCETIIHTLCLLVFLVLTAGNFKSRIFTIWSSYVYSEFVALPTVSYRKTCKYYNEDKCHGRKSIHF